MNNYAFATNYEMITGVRVNRDDYLPSLSESSGGMYGAQWLLCEDYNAANEATGRYWHDLAHNDERELLTILGEDNVVNYWLSGRTLDDIINEIGPAETFATYDGNECEVEDPETYIKREYPGVDYSSLFDDETGSWTENEQEDEELEEIRMLLVGWRNLCDELGFTPTIAYRM